MVSRIFPIERYRDVAKHPFLNVPQQAIIDAITMLDKIPALRLIRAAYRYNDGSPASLDDAREIHGAILSRRYGPPEEA